MDAVRNRRGRRGETGDERQAGRSRQGRQAVRVATGEAWDWLVVWPRHLRGRVWPGTCCGERIHFDTRGECMGRKSDKLDTADNVIMEHWKKNAKEEANG